MKKKRGQMTPEEIMFEEKKEVFSGFDIDWDDAIEARFRIEYQRHPNRDPRVILDQICRPYIMRKLGA